MSVVLADGNNGTNGTKRHLSSCPNYSHFGNRDVGQMILESSITGNMGSRSIKYDSGVHRKNMAMIVIMHELPFTFVDYEYVKYSYTSLVPEIKCVSRNTSQADILKIYKREKRKLFNLLQSLPGRVCLTSDMWTSIISDGYIILTAHYIDEDWVLQKKNLNFCFMPPPHSSVAIAEKISALLGSWNLDKKLFSNTLDNASANDTFVGIFKNTLRIKDALLVGGDFFHMRCCAHILNLMVQNGLKEIEKIIDKVRDSIKFVKRSQSRKKKFLDCATQLAIDYKKGLVQDVVTRWNSTYLMIESTLYYRNVFAHLALSDTNYVFCPELEEWNQVEYVFKFLKIFYDLTNIFYGAKYPTINLFFHGMWKIQALLKDELKNLNHFIRSMASKMQLKLDKY
ncbi:hypothetical protein Scep_001393 [Stephania cephalantha]|uniref:hAT-like transposase RNase-H fold domain-containing protein n=1 Tax=Stephania cephalantha TaxID=152367 RepID=A0AAP0L9B0_9MAGN